VGNFSQNRLGQVFSREAEIKGWTRKKKLGLIGSPV